MRLETDGSPAPVRGDKGRPRDLTGLDTVVEPLPAAGTRTSCADHVDRVAQRPNRPDPN